MAENWVPHAVVKLNGKELAPADFAHLQCITVDLRRQAPASLELQFNNHDGSYPGREDLGPPVFGIQLLQPSRHHLHFGIIRRVPERPEEVEEPNHQDPDDQGVSLFRIVRYESHSLFDRVTVPQDRERTREPSRGARLEAAHTPPPKRID